jgi:hypothetical protein
MDWGYVVKMPTSTRETNIDDIMGPGEHADMKMNISCRCKGIA